MNREYVLKLTFHSPWQVGSGLGDGAVADAVVLKDRLGLPTVPGRTIKGLVREAMVRAAEAGIVPLERVERWLGSPRAGLPGAIGEGEQDSQQESGRFGTKPGCLWFGSAGLSERWTHWASDQAQTEAGQPPEVAALYGLHASTSINEDGVAAEHTLRVVEAAVPMELRAKVVGPADDTTWQTDLRKCLPLIRALGAGRSRGFGRVSISVEDPK